MLSFLHGDPLQPGTEAPDFKLSDEQGKTVTLSELRGYNVVLIFYPADNTPVCRKQLCEFRDDWELAESKDTVVFGVNPGSGNSHSGFRDKLRLPFPLLVDNGSIVAGLYKSKGLLVNIRTVYVVGRDGRILYARRGKPTPSEVLAAAV
ncbi:MAG: peroxiredoxin [Bryobacteraceae bacterium]|nr:peroxiredoxin [Bryobacteraceae bacterium]